MEARDISAKRILIGAAENGALPRGKVGGMGDVVRELPLALAERNFDVTVVTPSYGMFSSLPGAKEIEPVEVRFGKRVERASGYELPGPDKRVRFVTLEHPLFSPNGDTRIYHDDGPGSPFSTDATKFAFFSAAVAEMILAAKTKPDVIHLHDWHTGLFFALRSFDSRFRELKDIRSVFTIHNLALQGTRPLDKSDSSLRAWFPELTGADEAVADPVYSDCVNPMATAIRLADMVNTVSPTYATEILEPAEPSRGFRGGEGLEAELRAAHAAGRLVGILNGCHYPEAHGNAPGWNAALATMESELTHWIAAETSLPSAHYLAQRRLTELPKDRPEVLLTSIGRLSEQKSRLFREPVDGGTALERILENLGDRGILMVLGNGDPALQKFFAAAGVRQRNLVFLQGYSDSLAQLLYATGDLFLMPSSFEPCGISQMLAMRAGQPCVVHAVGGLRDTVSAERGFPFDGDSPREQATNFAATVERALRIRMADQSSWRSIKEAAAAARFDWAVSAARYISDVYAIESG